MMVFGLLKERRRHRLQARPYPKEWLDAIRRNVRFFSRLSTSDQAELLGHIQVFLAEKRFEACGDLELTDDIRVTIAAQDGLLPAPPHKPHLPVTIRRGRKTADSGARMGRGQNCPAG